MTHSYVLTDQMGNNLSIPEKPKRIISLVPSQTELLFDLGLEEEIVGVTKFCVHPKDSVASKTIIGGTKKFRFETIHKLKPDIIFGNKEENYQSGIEQLKQNYPVWMSDIKTLDDAFDMINSLGRITGMFQNSLKLVRSIKNEFLSLPKVDKPKSVLYLIWQEPKMTVGGDTFIHHLLEKAGYINLAKSLSRYPELTDEDIESLRPDLIFLSSEPFPFREKHLKEFKNRFPKVKVSLVDGEMFSWYGSRLNLAPPYFRELLL